MTRIMDIVRGLSALLSDLALASLAVLLVPVITRQQVTIGYGAWMGCLAVQFLVSYWMMQTGISINIYLVFQTVAVAAVAYFTYTTSICVDPWNLGAGVENAAAVSMAARPGEPRSVMVFLVLCAAGSGLHGAWMAYRLPGSNTLVRYVDCLMVTLAFYLYAVYASDLPQDKNLAVLGLAAMALNLLMVNRLRTGEECLSVIQGAGNGTRLVLLLVFGACLALTGGIVGLASGQVHSLVDVLLVVLSGVWQVVYTVAGAVGMVLGYLILFVIALLPNAPPGARQRAMELVTQKPEHVEEYTGPMFPVWMLCVLAAAGVLAILYQLRGTRIRGVRLRARRRKVVRKSHLLSALRALVTRWLEWLRFTWDYHRYRKTPQGLFVLAERTGRKVKMGRRTWESPGAYLRRLAAVCEKESAGTEPESQVSLASVATLLDQLYYGGETPRMGMEEYQAYVRQIRALERQQFR